MFKLNAKSDLKISKSTKIKGSVPLSYQNIANDLVGQGYPDISNGFESYQVHKLCFYERTAKLHIDHKNENSCFVEQKNSSTEPLH